MMFEQTPASRRSSGPFRALLLRLGGWILALMLGVVLGAWLFHDVQSRPVLEPARSGSPVPRVSRKDLLGLLASAGIQHTPGLIPLVVDQDSHCMVVKIPTFGELRHFVAFPRQDIADIADLSRPGAAADAADCLRLLGGLIRYEGYRNYRVYTNGPDQQDVRFLHFHLLALPQATDGVIGERFIPGYPLPKP